MSNSSDSPAGQSQWDQASESAQTAATAAGQMAGHAALGVGELAGQAVGEVGRRADDAVASAGHGIQELGERLRQRSPEGGPFGAASRAVARGVQEGGEYLEESKLSGMADDVSNLIRKHPIPSILIGIGIGWFVGRKLKS
jgi:hypothetical protein